jgi:hypothetical protein
MATRKHPDDCAVIAVVGLAKNTGKTTTMNFLIARYRAEKIGLSSIGLDGEAIDLVTRLPKPRFDIRKHMVVATTTRCLEESDLEYDVLQETPFLTSLGRVMIVRVKRPAPVVIAGPTSNALMARLIDMMKRFCDRVLIDGAFDRKTFSNIPTIDGIILSTGASVSPDMAETIRRTVLFVEAFAFPLTHLPQSPGKEMTIRQKDGVQSSAAKSLAGFRACLAADGLDSIELKGAFTDAYVQALIDAGKGGFHLILEDATKLLVSPANQRHLKTLKINISVRHRTPIVLVTVNPYRPLGRNYDAKDFLQSVRHAIDLPVINVLGKDHPL